MRDKDCLEMVFKGGAGAGFSPVLYAERKSEKAVNIGIIRRAKSAADPLGNNAPFEPAEQLLVAVDPTSEASGSSFAETSGRDDRASSEKIRVVGNIRPNFSISVSSILASGSAGSMPSSSRI